MRQSAPSLERMCGADFRIRRCFHLQHGGPGAEHGRTIAEARIWGRSYPTKPRYRCATDPDTAALPRSPVRTKVPARAMRRLSCQGRQVWTKKEPTIAAGPAKLLTTRGNIFTFGFWRKKFVHPEGRSLSSIPRCCGYATAFATISGCRPITRT